MTDTIVIGSGLAGLCATIRLAEAGQKVTLLSFGAGGIHLGQGSIDILGYVGPDQVERPFEALASCAATHPYSRLGAEALRGGIDWLEGVLGDLVLASDERNHLVPTAVGAMRPTYLIQPSQSWPNPDTVAVVGVRQLKDFYPSLVAANLERTASVTATSYRIDLPAREGEIESSPVLFATALDRGDFLDLFIAKITERIKDEQAICLAGVLGLRNPEVHRRIVEALDRPVVEAMMAPPSIPGMRINEALLARVKNVGARIIIGSKVVDFTAEGRCLTSVTLAQAGRLQAYAAKDFVYCPGGFESGALAMDSYGKVTETLFGLPLSGLDHTELITGDYWADQQLFLVGVDVDSDSRPIGGGDVVFENLYAAGGLLGGALRTREKSGDGIAVASAIRAAEAILRVRGAH